MSAPAWKVVGEIADGYVILSPVVLKRYQDAELGALQVEIDRLTREIRSQVTPTDDADAMQKKSRRLLRLSGALQVLATFRSRSGKPGSSR